MNRLDGKQGIIETSIPHACGDEPLVLDTANTMSKYSPRMWG